MGQILDEIMSEIKDQSFDQQVIELCEMIFNQEKEDISEEVLSALPTGPNIILALPCPGLLKGDGAFLTLEREMSEHYIVGHWLFKSSKLMRSKIWEVKEVNSKRVLRRYAEILKYLKGE